MVITNIADMSCKAARFAYASYEFNDASKVAAIVRGPWVAIRGTHNLETLRADLRFAVEKTPFGYVHRGFWNQYLSLRSFLQQTLPDYIVGHSLGGALAYLAALEYKPKVLITFGCPRIGFIKKPKCRIYHFQNNNDIIPRVPIFYRLPGNKYYINRKNEIYKNPNLFYKVWDRLTGYNFGDWQKEHYISTYRSMICGL